MAVASTVTGGGSRESIPGHGLSFYLSCFIILYFVLLFSSTASKPLHLDNVDFPAVAKQTALTGLPIYYRGEDRQHYQGLFHPPLYIYMLAGWMRLFGSGEAPARMFGMICALLQGWVVLAILRTLFSRERISQWEPFFWAIYLLNPFTLQTATIPDIDSTIYGPLLGAALLATLRISWRDGEWRADEVRRVEYALVLTLLVLCLCAKLTTVALTFPFVFFLLIARLGVRRSALAAVALTAISIATFAAGYFLYGVLTGMDIGYTYQFTWTSFLSRGTSATPGLMARLEDYSRNFRWMGPFMLSWTGIVPWLAVVVALGLSIMTAIRRHNRRLLHYALVLGLALLSTLYYCAKVITFGAAPFRYVFVYWGVILTAPLFVLTNGHWRALDLRFASRARWMGAVLLALSYAGTATWAATHIRDSLMLDGFKGPYTIDVYAPAILFTAGLLLRHAVPPASAAALLAVAISAGLQLGTAVYQERVPYATTYDYGQTGFLDTVAFLKTHTKPGDIIASMKDIGYRTGLRYYETYHALYDDPEVAARLKQTIASGQVAYMVFTEGRGQDQLAVNPSFQQWILKHCTLVRSFGNYRVYQTNEVLRRQREVECGVASSRAVHAELVPDRER